MKTYTRNRGNRGTVPLILNLDIRWMWVASQSGHFEKDKISYPCRDSTPHCPPHSLVSTPTKVAWLHSVSWSGMKLGISKMLGIWNLLKYEFLGCNAMLSVHIYPTWHHIPLNHNLITVKYCWSRNSWKCSKMSEYQEMLEQTCDTQHCQNT